MTTTPKCVTAGWKVAPHLMKTAVFDNNQSTQTELNMSHVALLSKLQCLNSSSWDQTWLVW